MAKMGWKSDEGQVLEATSGSSLHFPLSSEGWENGQWGVVVVAVGFSDRLDLVDPSWSHSEEDVERRKCREEMEMFVI